MGSLGSYHAHPYATQSLAFLVTLLFPAGAFVLVAGSLFEKARRKAGRFLPDAE
jgi:hypothetical protein